MDEVLAGIRAIGTRRLRDTERLSKYAETGDFEPPCDWLCEGVIVVEIDGERVSGACPVIMLHPGCQIPKREAYERHQEMRRRGWPEKYLREATWEKCRATEKIQAWLGDREKSGLLIHGPVGTGKTMAAALVGQVLWSEGMESRFVPWPQMLIDFEKSETRGDAMRLYAEAALLVIDDFGVGEMAPWVHGYVDLLFERRNSGRRSTIVTTNLTPDSLRAEESWSRFVDRWSESMMVLAIPGKSMRNAT